MGSDAYRFGGNRICSNKQIRTENLDIAVWEEIKDLLKNPQRILEEYHRRIIELEKSPLDHMQQSIEKQKNKLKQGIARLIDSYTQEYLSKEEFEPRIKTMRQHLKSIEKQESELAEQKSLKKELTLIGTNLEQFAFNIQAKLESIEWHTKRDVIRALVKRIEINPEEVNVVFRIKELGGSSGNALESGSGFLQHCWPSISYLTRHGFLLLMAGY
jgi:site-specific DNA recombinase